MGGAGELAQLHLGARTGFGFGDHGAVGGDHNAVCPQHQRARVLTTDLQCLHFGERIGNAFGAGLFRHKPCRDRLFIDMGRQGFVRHAGCVQH